jgi:23S rRNA (adenine2503-C2)-methyltransferase
METVAGKIHLLNLDPAELAARVVALGMPKFRATQVLEWVYQRRVDSFEAMTNLSVPHRALLAEHFSIYRGTVVRHLTASDGTEKVLIRWPSVVDAAAGAEPSLTETVMIPADEDAVEDGVASTVKQRRTACLSTQVGCPVGCAFCASGLEGLKGNLTAGDIVEQALWLTRALPADGRLTNIVFMGMGEPLANYAATVKAIHTLRAPWGLGIGGRKITVSTVGLPPQMRKLADEKLPVTLAISLHAPNDELRKQIIPWAKGISVADIVSAGQHYFNVTGREVTLEYIMLDGVNTLPEHAVELAGIARRMRANVNLIYYNEVPELAFKRPSGGTALGFQNVLREHGVNVHIRRSRGRDIAAACGQLARQDRAERLEAETTTEPRRLEGMKDHEEMQRVELRIGGAATPVTMEPRRRDGAADHDVNSKVELRIGGVAVAKDVTGVKEGVGDGE